MLECFICILRADSLTGFMKQSFCLIRKFFPRGSWQLTGPKEQLGALCGCHCCLGPQTGSPTEYIN